MELRTVLNWDLHESVMLFYSRFSEKAYGGCVVGTEMVYGVTVVGTERERCGAAAEIAYGGGAVGTAIAYGGGAVGTEIAYGGAAVGTVLASSGAEIGHGGGLVGTETGDMAAKQNIALVRDGMGKKVTQLERKLQSILLRVCCAIPGTDTQCATALLPCAMPGADRGDGATRRREMSADSIGDLRYLPTRLLCDVRYWHSVLRNSPRRVLCDVRY
eukprot:1673542-Rhodomonas_salina.1